MDAALHLYSMADRPGTDTNASTRTAQHGDRTFDPSDRPKVSDMSSSAQSASGSHEPQAPTREALLEAFRKDWNFTKMFDDMHEGKIKRRLKTYFTYNDNFKTKTLKAFKMLAELVKTAGDRDKRLEQLRQALRNRMHGGNMSQKLGGGPYPKWGRTPARQDKSVREEVKKLIKAKDPDYEDQDDDEDGGEGVENSGAGNVTQDVAAMSAPRVRVRGQGTSRSQDCEPSNHTRDERARRRQERLEQIAAILENWELPITEYLPPYARPISPFVGWPDELIGALVELSRATSKQPAKDVRSKLQPAFESAGKFSLKKSVKAIEKLRDFLINNERAPGSQDTIQAPSAPALRQNVGDPDIQAAGDIIQERPPSTQVDVSEAPHQAGKRRNSRPISPERDLGHPKKPKPTPGHASTPAIPQQISPRHTHSIARAPLSVEAPVDVASAPYSASVASANAQATENHPARPQQENEGLMPTHASLTSSPTAQTSEHNLTKTVARHVQLQSNRFFAPHNHLSGEANVSQAVLAYERARDDHDRATDEVRRTHRAVSDAYQRMTWLARPENGAGRNARNDRH